MCHLYGRKNIRLLDCSGAGRNYGVIIDLRKTISSSAAVVAASAAPPAPSA